MFQVDCNVILWFRLTRVFWKKKSFGLYGFRSFWVFDFLMVLKVWVNSGYNPCLKCSFCFLLINVYLLCVILTVLKLLVPSISEELVFCMQIQWLFFLKLWLSHNFKLMFYRCSMYACNVTFISVGKSMKSQIN